MWAKLTSAAALLLVTGSGCKSVYSPNIASAPLLQKKGELRATADVSNLQAAYAATSHIGLMANFFFRSRDETLEGNGERQVGEGTLLEVAPGWFTTIHPRWLQVEVYGGLGVGHVKQQITPMGGMTRTFEADGTRFFVMPSAGFSGKYFEAAFSARLAAVQYHDIVTDNYSQGELDGDKLTGLEDRTWFFLEPALTVRAGYKWVKLQVQFGQSYKLNEADMNREKGMFTIALHVDLFRPFDPPADVE